MQTPINVKIWKHQKAQSVFKGYDLIIQGSLFSDLYAQFKAKHHQSSSSLQTEKAHSSATTNEVNYSGALENYNRVGNEWQAINNHKSAGIGGPMRDEFKFNFQTNRASQKAFQQFVNNQAPQQIEEENHYSESGK